MCTLWVVKKLHMETNISKFTFKHIDLRHQDEVRRDSPLERLHRHIPPPHHGRAVVLVHVPVPVLHARDVGRALVLAAVAGGVGGDGATGGGGRGGHVGGANAHLRFIINTFFLFLRAKLLFVIRTEAEFQQCITVGF